MLELALPIILASCSFAVFFMLFNRFIPTLNSLERAGLSIPVSLVLTGWAFLLISSVVSIGFNSGLIVLALFLVLALLCFIIFNLKMPLPARVAAFVSTNRAFLVFLSAFLFLAGYLFNTHILQVVGGSIYSGGYTRYDLYFHEMIIKSFLFGPNRVFALNNIHFPLLEGAKFYYPLIPDVVSTVFAALGASIRDSIILPGMLLAFSLAALFYSFFFRFSRDKRVAVLALALFVLAGGLGFVQFPYDVQSSGAGVFGYLGHLSWDYEWTLDGSFNHHYLWDGFFGANFLPQSSSRFAFPLLAGIFLLAWVGLGASRLERRKLFLLAGVLVGLLPFVQGKALYSVAVVLGLVCILFADWSNIVEWFADWCFLGVPAVLLGVPQVLYFYHQASGWGFFHFSPMWGNAGFWGVAWFLFRSTGFLLPVALVGCLFLDDKQRKFYFGFIVLFAVAYLFNFQSWYWDNEKILYTAAILTCCVAAIVIVRLWNHRDSVGKILGLAVLILLVLSGSLSLLFESQTHSLMYSPQDQALGSWVSLNTPADSVFLTGEGFNPIFSIGGRQLVVDRASRLNDEGYSRFDHVYSDEREIYAGGSNALVLLAKYNVSYVQISENERQEFTVNDSFFNSRFPLVFEYNNLQVKIFGVAATSFKRKFRSDSSA